MGYTIDVLGVLLLVTFICISQVYIVYRGVISIKRYLRYLQAQKEDIDDIPFRTVHYDEAWVVLYSIHKEKLERARRSFWGKILGIITSQKIYEIS